MITNICQIYFQEFSWFTEVLVGKRIQQEYDIGTVSKLNFTVRNSYKNGMTEYRVDRIDHVDRIITGAYTEPLVKQHCAVLRHALTLMWTVMTLPNALDAFRPNHFVLLVDGCAESGPNIELCDCDSTDYYNDSSEADDEQPAASAVVWNSD